jgi:hypothetical protein
MLTAPDVYAQQLPPTMRVFDVPSVTVSTNSRPSPGYIFLATVNVDSYLSNHLLILNEHGVPVFDRMLPMNGNGILTDFKPQSGQRYSFCNFSENKFYILDKDFQLTDSISAQYAPTDNHELLIDERNHYFLMGKEQRLINMADSVSGGSTSATVTGIVVQELDSTKNLVFEWKTLDHLPVTQCKGQDLTAASIDYIHTNSLWPDTDSTLLLSNRHFNEITKINTRTGAIVWRMGLQSSGNEFTFINDSVGFSYQHCVRRLPNGNIILFDNGNVRPGPRYSRACEYAIDEINKTATLVWQYRNTPDVVSDFMGSVQRLPNGNTLIGWGGTVPTATEVDALGNKIFECSLPQNARSYSYRALKFEIPNIDSLRNADPVAVPDSVRVSVRSANAILEELFGDAHSSENEKTFCVVRIDTTTTTLAYKNPNDFISYKTITLIDNLLTSVTSNATSSTLPQMMLYPNPSNGHFRLITNIAEAVPVSIYNALGQIVVEKNVVESEAFSNLPTGVYSLVMSYRGKFVQRTFVVTE